MGIKNKFKPKVSGSATPWKAEEQASGEAKTSGVKASAGIKKSIFNRKAG